MVTADGAYHIRLTRRSTGAVHGEMRPAERAAEGEGWLSRPDVSVSRGWSGEALPPKSGEELEVERLRPAALVLVVHGVGEALWSKPTQAVRDIEASVSRLRTNAALALSSALAQPVSSDDCQTGGEASAGGGERSLTRV